MKVASVDHAEMKYALGLFQEYIGKYSLRLQDFTEEERDCLAREIPKISDEPDVKSREQAFAIAVQKCAPAKARQLRLQVEPEPAAAATQGTMATTGDDPRDGHSHDAILDQEGNGVTSLSSGTKSEPHFHRVVRGEVVPHTAADESYVSEHPGNIFSDGEQLQDDPTPQLPGGKYTAKQNADGSWDIINVPMFVEHDVIVGEGKDRKVLHIGQKWMEAAKDTQHARMDQDNYLPPLHLHHHGLGKETVRAGFWMTRDVKEAEYQGRKLWVTFGDYLSVPDGMYKEFIRTGQLPYRSVEIKNVMRQEIDSLALLDTEVPFFRLPLLTIGQEIPHGGTIGPVEKVNDEIGITRAYRHVGQGAAVLMYMDNAFMEATMPNQPIVKKPKAKGGLKLQEPEEEKKPENLVSDTGEKKPEEQMQANTPEERMKAAAEMITGCADMLVQAAALLKGEEPTGEAPTEAAPEPVEVEMAAKMAAGGKATKVTPVQPKPAAKKPAAPKTHSDPELAARVDILENEGTKNKLLAETGARMVSYGLDGKTVGKRLEKLYAEGGQGSVKSYAAAIEEHFQVDPPATLGGAAGGGEAPAEVLKYQSLGQEGMELAYKLSTEYDDHKARGMNFSYSKEYYLAQNLNAEGFKVEMPKDPEPAKK